MRLRSTFLVIGWALSMQCSCGGPPTKIQNAPVTELQIASTPTDAKVAESDEREDPATFPPASDPRTLQACAMLIRQAQHLKQVQREVPGEALYARGLEQEQAGQLNEARKSYFELVQKMPSSPYVPLVYLAFGELFYHEADNDPSKLPIALQAYKKVLTFPPPDNAASVYTHYQTAQVYKRQEDNTQALAQLKTTIDQATLYPQLPCTGLLAKQARLEIVQVYAVIGQPQKAESFFRMLSGDRGSESSKTLEMVMSLAEVYAATSKFDESIYLLTTLASREKSAAICGREAMLIKKLQSFGLSPDHQRSLNAIEKGHQARCAP